MQTVLVTGGAGFVGSHCVIELIESGYEVIVIDNLHNSVADEGSFPVSLKRIQDLTNRKIHFYYGDVRNLEDLRNIFSLHDIHCVIHCAALKRNAESPDFPLEYYSVNVGGTINLLQAMKEYNVKNIVFSGSCTVYGKPDYLPVDEKHPVGTGCTTPYAWSKYMVERMLQDTANATEGRRVFSYVYEGHNTVNALELATVAHSHGVLLPPVLS